METQKKFNSLLPKLEKIQRWINDDLSRASINAQANFLVAMGIFNYIEILGSFYVETKSCTERFNGAFKELMPKEYKKVFDQIKTLKLDVYEILRCGMTHEYIVKTDKNKGIELDYTIYGIVDQGHFDDTIKNNSVGLILNEYSTNKYKLDIINPRLIFDLNTAFENFKTILKNNTDQQKIFIKRANEINLEKFN